MTVSGTWMSANKPTKNTVTGIDTDIDSSLVLTSMNRPRARGQTAASYDLRPLRRPGLADGLVEPHHVAKRVHDLEGPVAPPLHGQRVRDLYAFLLEFLVVGRDVGDFQIDLHRLLSAARLGRRQVVMGSRKHEPRAVQDDGDEVELAVLSEHAHDVIETERVNEEIPGLVRRFHRDDRQDMLCACFH